MDFNFSQSKNKRRKISFASSNQIIAICNIAALCDNFIASREKHFVLQLKSPEGLSMDAQKSQGSAQALQLVRS